MVANLGGILTIQNINAGIAADKLLKGSDKDDEKEPQPNKNTAVKSAADKEFKHFLKGFPDAIKEALKRIHKDNNPENIQKALATVGNVARFNTLSLVGGLPLTAGGIWILGSYLDGDPIISRLIGSYSFALEFMEFFIGIMGPTVGILMILFGGATLFDLRLAERYIYEKEHELLQKNRSKTKTSTLERGKASLKTREKAKPLTTEKTKSAPKSASATQKNAETSENAKILKNANKTLDALGKTVIQLQGDIEKLQGAQKH